MNLGDRTANAFAKLVREAALPELPLLPISRARIVSQGVDQRVSLQMVVRDGETPDTAGTSLSGRVYLWGGVPGVSADVTPGQEVILAYARGEASDPVAFAATPRGQPGHVPIKVYHEATTEIRVVGNSAGVVRVGPGLTQPVALEPPTAAFLAAVRVFATAAKVSTDPVVAAAALVLEGALTAIPSLATTRLESL